MQPNGTKRFLCGGHGQLLAARCAKKEEEEQISASFSLKINSSEILNGGWVTVFTGRLTVQPGVAETRRDSAETDNIPLLVRSGKSNWIGLN